MKSARVAVVALLLAAAGMGSVGVASAAPSGAPSASSMATFDCGTAGVYTGFANSGNSQALTWNPFFLTAADGSTKLLVPTANDLVVTVANVGVVFAPNARKGSSVGAVTCTVTGGGGDVTVSGSVTGSLAPA